MKKIIAYLLVLAIILSSVCSLSVSAAKKSKYTESNIIIDRYGKHLVVKVFINENGAILIPADVLSFCGGLRKASNSSAYIYFTGQYGLKFERQIHISKNGTSGKSVLCVSGEEHTTISSTDFSDSYKHETGLYLPLIELLPFLDAKIEITSDGILHIYANPVSIFNAISYENMEHIAFDMDDIVGGNFVGATGMIIDTILNFRFDRLDIVTDSGAIKDYNKIFKNLLVDNDVYLSAFDTEKTPFENALEVFDGAFDDFNDSVESLDDSNKAIKAVDYMIGSKLFNDSKEFAEDLDNLEAFADVIDGVFKTISYANAYIQQVKDHRDMLSVVYGGKYYTNSAKCNAAKETAQLYGEDTVDQIFRATTTALREYIVKAGSGAITKKMFMPYKIAFEVTKFICPEMEKTFANAANIFYFDTIVSDSTSVANDCLNNMKFEEESLNNLRLSLIMALLTSKQAYAAYYGELSEEDKTKVATVGSVTWKQIQINQWLEQLYLAADSVEGSTVKHYKTVKSELADSVKNLKEYKQGELEESEGLEFRLNSDGKSYAVAGIGLCSDENIAIPKTFNGMPVTSISEAAFNDCSNLSSVTIPDSITSIETSAFAHCSSLTSIKIPGSVTVIGDSVFAFCTNLVSVDILDGVTSIGDSAFLGCTGIKKVSLPDSITSISEYAFYECSSLTCVAIPDGVTSIGEQAFAYCSNFTSITIPNCVTNIDIGAFFDCKALKDVYYIGTESEWKNITIGISNDCLKNATIHCSSINAETSASQGLEFTLNSDGKTYSVTGIGTCTDKNVVIPQTYNGLLVTGIGNAAFKDCFEITNISIPNSIKGINNSAFENCSKLKSIYIPESTISIGSFILAGCTKLETLIVDNKNTKYHSQNNCIIRTADKCLIAGCNTSKIPDDESVTQIADWALYKCDGLTSLIIPNSVVSIGNFAFRECVDLSSIVIPNSVTSIGIYAFEKCYSLTSVSIPNSATSLGYGMFLDCQNLTNVSLPNSITSIEDSFFKNCMNLSNVTIPTSITNIKNYAFCGCEKLTSVEISNGVVSIGVSAFYECFSFKNVYYFGTEAEWNAITVQSGNDALKNATIHFESVSDDSLASQGLEFTLNSDGKSYSLTGIGTCTNTAVVIPSIYNGLPVTSIGVRAFGYCRSLTSVIIPDSVTSIGDYVFDDCTSLTSVTIGNSVTSIGDFVFDGCTSLTSVNIPDSVTSIESGAFYNCSSLVSIIIPDSITIIGNYAFYNCTGLSSITIPNSLTSIAPRAFLCCTSLTRVTIPDGVTSIGEQAFAYCSSFTSITIPNSVTNIDIGAFFDCKALKDVYYIGTETEWENITIGISNDCLKNATIHCSSINADTSASQGLEFALNSDGKTYSVLGIGTCPDQDVVIPAKYNDMPVTSIGEKAFKDCTNLTSITIPDSVTSIGEIAFYNCSNLTSVTIGNSVTSIGDRAFYGCSKLIMNDENNPYLLFITAKSTSIVSCQINSNTRFIHSAYIFPSSVDKLK